MHRVPADYVSLFLRFVEWEATDRGVAVRDLLKEIARARLSSTAEGLSLIGTAADGSSVTYAIPSPVAGMTLNPETLALMVGRLWDWIDEIILEDAEATDAEILAGLRTRAKPIRVFRPNFVLQSPR
jgi:hypothetical protein